MELLSSNAASRAEQALTVLAACVMSVHCGGLCRGDHPSVSAVALVWRESSVEEHA